MAVAEASLRTEKVSMSFGFTDASGSPMPAPPSPVTGTPSMTMSGSLFALSEAAPRIRIVEEEPGCPDGGVTSRPETLPTRAWPGVVMAPRFTSSLLIATTDPVMSLFFTVPYPITTTSSRNSASSASSTVPGRAEAVKTWVAYPMQDTSITASAPETVRT